LKRLFTWILLSLSLLFVFNAQAANAQSDNRSLRWQRYDVTIDSIDTANNKFNVTESYVLDILPLWYCQHPNGSTNRHSKFAYIAG
jgi:hypothetical protein